MYVCEVIFSESKEEEEEKAPTYSSKNINLLYL